jgi:serine/threonine-protein kinase OSR1/STK39
MGGCEATNFLGLPGQRRSVRLDLKLIADVGFVGFPNAGKSTLLKALSRARPKIASYPFTTLRPNLGVAEFDDFRRIAFADLPGLIEGAHLNEGMGHKFLKHVERTRVLLFVVDINGFQFKPEHPFRSAFETVLLLNRELELYKEELMNKPALCVVTKMDSKGSDRLYESFLEQMEKVQQRAGDEPRISTSRLSEESGEVGDEEEMININRLVHFDEIIPVSAKFSPKTVEVLKYKVRDWMDTYALNDDTRLHADQIAATLREKSNLY